MFAARLSGEPEGFREYKQEYFNETAKQIRDQIKRFYTIAEHCTSDLGGKSLHPSILKLSSEFLSTNRPKQHEKTLYGASPLTTQRILDARENGISIIDHAHKEIKRCSNPDLLALCLCLEIIYLYADLERASESNGDSFDNKQFHFKAFLTDLLHRDLSALDRMPAKSTGYYYTHFEQLRSSVESILNSIHSEQRWLITDAALNMFFRCYLNPIKEPSKPKYGGSEFVGRFTLLEKAPSNYKALATNVDAVFQLAYNENATRFFLYSDPHDYYKSEPHTHTHRLLPNVIHRAFEAPYENPKLTQKNSKDSDTSSASSSDSSHKPVRNSTFASIARGLNPFAHTAASNKAVEIEAPPVMAVAVAIADNRYVEQPATRLKTTPTGSPSQSPDTERRTRSDSASFRERMSCALFGIIPERSSHTEENGYSYVHQTPTAPPLPKASLR